MEVKLQASAVLPKGNNMPNGTIIGLVLAMAAVGCAEQHPEEANSQNSVGADRDGNGCIGSAGYTWCAHTNSCERPWELANKAGFENSTAEFTRYCDK